MVKINKDGDKIIAKIKTKKLTLKDMPKVEKEIKKLLDTILVECVKNDVKKHIHFDD